MPGGLPRVRPGIAVTRPACGHKPGAADTRDTDTGQGREERPNIRKHRKSENKILDNLQTFYVEMCVAQYNTGLMSSLMTSRSGVSMLALSPVWVMCAECRGR